MVRLEEVEDEAFLQHKEFDGAEDDDYTDTGEKVLLSSFPLCLWTESTAIAILVYLLYRANRYRLDSSISGDEADDDLPLEESLADRISALKDIVSPTTRRRLNGVYETISNYARSGFWLGAKGAYAISVTALFIGVPFSLLYVDDTMLAEQENQMKAREMGNEVSNA